MRGRKILQELEQLLPKIEGLVVPTVFDPKKERSNFRISGPDNVCIALLPHLCRRYTTESFKVNFDFLPWQADAVDMQSSPADGNLLPESIDEHDVAI